MKHLLILYSHFYPAYKAGGPVQSLTNMVEVLQDDFTISVVCSAYDLGEKDLLNNIQPDAWNEYRKNVSVFYATGNGYKTVRRMIRDRQPDVIYINGMFHPVYTWLPLVLANKSKQKVVIAPRGMLQSGALAMKPIKKKFFLVFFKLFGLHKNIIWHATDVQEKRDIQTIFGENSSVSVVANIPKLPAPVLEEKKLTQPFRMIFLSLITEKKNLHLVLEALQRVKTKIQFHIYGPIKDQYYWRKCQRLMADQIHDVQYLGPVEPMQVQQKFASYDAFILPTKGENFGHAIYESLSVGTPVLVSPFTPWGDLKEHQAGITITTFHPEDWAKAIKTFLECDQQEYAARSRGAYQLAKNYFEKNDFKAQYRCLFL